MVGMTLFFSLPLGLSAKDNIPERIMVSQWEETLVSGVMLDRCSKSVPCRTCRIEDHVVPRTTGGGSIDGRISCLS